MEDALLADVNTDGGGVIVRAAVRYQAQPSSQALSWLNSSKSGSAPGIVGSFRRLDRRPQWAVRVQ
jgi:hypothetical protein